MCDFRNTNMLNHFFIFIYYSYYYSHELPTNIKNAQIAELRENPIGNRRTSARIRRLGLMALYEVSCSLV